MNLRRIPLQIGCVLSALALSLSFQSCNKQEDNVSPASSAISQEAVMGAPTCTSVCLVAGQHTYVGTVDAGIATNGDLRVTYNSTVGILETHLDVFSTYAAFAATKKVNNGNAVPGQFTYKQSFSSPGVMTTTIIVPASVVSTLPTPFYIAAHAALANGETAWGGLCTNTGSGVSLSSAFQFPGKNWGVYFSFNRNTCPADVSFTYAWEDRIDEANDADYNDLVIQSQVVRSANLLNLKFTAKARGAGFEHKFRFRIPKTGVTGIYSAVPNDLTVTDDGTYYHVTVFESTQTALPGNSNGFANTETGSCVAPVMKYVNVTTDGSFSYDENKPYEPYITVYTRGATGPNYDLYVRSITDRGGINDTYVLPSNHQVYPNGIVIPSDWKWPLEMTPITSAYPTFTSLTPSFNPNWYMTAPVAGTTYVPTCF